MKFSLFMGIFLLLAGTVEAKEPANFLSPAQVREITGHKIGAIKRCYKVVLRREPTQFGTVTVDMHVNSSGSVGDAWIGLSSLGNERLESCILTALKKLKFPPRKRAKLVSVSLLLSTSSSSSEVMQQTQRIFRPKGENQ